MKKLIVSRHLAAIQFIRRADPEFIEAPVLANATPDDVRGAVVAGNLPMHLAALAEEVIAVEFDGPPPRGQEYSYAAMISAGARLARYRVESLSECHPMKFVGWGYVGEERPEVVTSGYHPDYYWSDDGQFLGPDDDDRIVPLYRLPDGSLWPLEAKPLCPDEVFWRR